MLQAYFQAETDLLPIVLDLCGDIPVSTDVVPQRLIEKVVHIDIHSCLHLFAECVSEVEIKISASVIVSSQTGIALILLVVLEAVGEIVRQSCVEAFENKEER